MVEYSYYLRKAKLVLNIAHILGYLVVIQTNTSLGVVDNAKSKVGPKIYLIINLLICNPSFYYYGINNPYLYTVTP